MGKKDFIKGMEAGAKPFEQKFEELSNNTKKVGEKVNEKLDGLGAVMDVVMDDLSDMQKKELYNLNTPFDLKEDLDAEEKEILAALLLRLSEYTENNEYQKRFIRSVNTYIDVKSPQVGFDISRIENIENIKSQKILMQTAMEYLYLASEDFSFLEELEDEVFEHFSVNRKGIREIEGYINAVARAVGKDGIAEKYGFVPEEQQEEGKIDEETFRLYKETTPYDLCKDLISDEKEILCNLLAALKNESDSNKVQQTFLDILEKEEKIVPVLSETEPDIDSVDNVKSQRIILQVLMEYSFLATGDFSFMENKIFDGFSINKKEISQIKNDIQKIYDEQGYQGLCEKYKYLSMNQLEKMEDTDTIGEYPKIQQACADRVNVQPYAELKEYLVYFDSESRILYKVHKYTGERTQIRKMQHPIDGSQFCGIDNKVCFSIGNQIKIINIDTNEENDIKVIFEQSNNYYMNWSKSANATRLQCNTDYLVYNTTVKEENAIICVDFKNYNSVLIANDNKLSLHSNRFFLDGNMLYMIVRERGEGAFSFSNNLVLYRYNLKTAESERLLQVEGASEWKADNVLYGNELLRYKEYIMGYSMEEHEIDLWYLNLHNIEDRKVRKISLNEYDTEFLEGEVRGIQNYLILFTTEGGLCKYDILKGEMSTIAMQSDCVDSAKKGMFNTSIIYSLAVYEISLINDTLYYMSDENAVYKTPINECSESAELI